MIDLTATDKRATVQIADEVISAIAGTAALEVEGVAGMAGNISGDIAEALGMSQSAISHQLRSLKQSKLVKYRRDGKAVLYSLADAHVRTMVDQGMEHILE